MTHLFSGSLFVRHVVLVCSFFVPLASSIHSAQQPPSTAEPLHRPFDQLLDLYVRDGLVYYRAVRADRARLDRYLGALGGVSRGTYDGWSREQKIAFWLNAYNAFVLQTVAASYPPRGNSVRNIPGAFDKRPHRAAGRNVTLDEIENEVLPEFRDPRVYFALGRGALGSGRLRSEAYTAARLEEQLAAQTSDFLERQNHVRIDQLTGELQVSPIIGWHEAEFVTAYAEAERAAKFADRSPIERAVLALVDPVLLPSERAYLAKGQFKISYQEFDWSLNELK
jgi:hypothetical protein